MLDNANAKTIIDFTRVRDASLPPYMVQNVDAVMGIRHKTELDVGFQQRTIERVTALLGRPAALYAVLLTVVTWSLLNIVMGRLGLPVLDPPPFFWLQGLVGLAALLVASLVLITQNRQAKLIERRMHLDLQVDLITEHKTAKLIELVEELRRDLPGIRQRRDPEAESMQHPSHPVEVVAALDRKV